MKIFKEVIIRLLLALFLVGSIFPIFEIGIAIGDGEAIIVDYDCTDITQIPEWAILAAKDNLHIGYGHTSHGAQITTGMTGLVAYANDGGLGLSLPTDIFAWNNGGAGGALDLEEGAGYDDGWLEDTCGEYAYFNPPRFLAETREYLDDTSHSDVNVIMWSWCYEADDEYAAGVIESHYLEPMNQLEAEYPDVDFVYMTGTVNKESMGIYTEVIGANQIIRNYCNTNNKILYDFAEIEHGDPVWDPAGNYYQVVDEECNYYADSDIGRTTPLGNWATEWQDSHPGDWYNSSNVHTQDLNCNLKAYAAWWLWARLAGWDGQDTELPSVTLTSPNGDDNFKHGCQYDITWSATDDIGVTSCNISYSTNNGTSYTDIATGETNDGIYTWTVPNDPSATCLVKVTAGDAAGNWGQDESDAVFEIFGPIPGDANNDCIVDITDVTMTERIILELDTCTDDADANEDTFVNTLDITSIERLIYS